MAYGEKSLEIRAPQELLQAAAEAWARFLRDVPNHPLGAWPCERPLAGDACVNIANSSVHWIGNFEPTAAIRLRKDFFELNHERQTLTLLHETLHVDLLSGPWREWYREGQTFEGKYFPVREEDGSLYVHDMTVVDNGAFGIALTLFKFPNEIAAEKQLQSQYPEWSERRAAYYLDMRKADQTGDERSIHSDVQPYDALLTLLRTELGAVISTGMIREQAEILRANAYQELQGSKRPGLCDLVPTLMEVDALPRHFNEDAYRAIFQEALHSRPPASTPKTGPA